MSTACRNPRPTAEENPRDGVVRSTRCPHDGAGSAIEGRDAIIWFCATGRTGLGHLRRCTSIALAVRGMSPEPLGLLTNAEPRGLPEAELASFSVIRVLERDRLAAFLGDATDLGPVVVDTAAIPGLGALGRRLILVLRETPTDRQARFALDAGRSWDLVIVPNPGRHWMPDPGKVPTAAFAAVGWIYRATPPSVGRSGRAIVLVATGGGGSAETAAALREILDPVIEQARPAAPGGFEVVQAIGPRATADGRLRTADRTIDPGGDLNRHFADADIVISTAGYNSVLELASLDTPTMLVAIPRSIDDQAGRARLWGGRLGHWHDGNIRAAAEWLARTVAARERRAPWDLGPSGAGAAARLILDMAR